MIEPLALTDVVEWVLENALGIGVSTTAILLLILAVEGHKVLGLGRRLGFFFRALLLAVGLIALLLGLGILRGLDLARAGVILGELVSAIGRLAGLLE